MKQKDITEKLLEDYEDVFADIVNVLLFDGNQLISPDALATIKSMFLKLHGYPTNKYLCSKVIFTL